MIYGDCGIATKESVNFLQENFPIPVLCMLAGMVSPIPHFITLALTVFQVRGVLQEHTTGVNKTKESKENKVSYRPHYLYFMNICTEIARSGSAYHISLLADATRDIVQTGW